MWKKPLKITKWNYLAVGLPDFEKNIVALFFYTSQIASINPTPSTIYVVVSLVDKV